MKYVAAFCCAALVAVLWSDIYANDHTRLYPLRSYRQTRVCTDYAVDVPVLYGLWHAKDTVTKC